MNENKNEAKKLLRYEITIHFEFREKAFQFQNGIIAGFSTCTWFIYEISGRRFVGIVKLK